MQTKDVHSIETSTWSVLHEGLVCKRALCNGHIHAMFKVRCRALGSSVGPSPCAPLVVTGHCCAEKLLPTTVLPRINALLVQKVYVYGALLYRII